MDINDIPTLISLLAAGVSVFFLIRSIRCARRTNAAVREIESLQNEMRS